MKRVALVNKETLIVENVIISEIPNMEDPQYLFVSLEDKKYNAVGIGWKYEQDSHTFSTDDPQFQFQVKSEYTKEEMLFIEEQAWEKMLKAVSMGQKLNEIAGQTQKKSAKKTTGTKKSRKQKTKT